MDKIDFEKYAESIPKPEIRTDTQPQQDIEVDDVWKIVTENLRMVLDRVEYDSWFAGTHLERVQNGVATLSCSNDFKRETILKDYNKFLQSCLTKATGQNLQIEIVVKQQEQSSPKERYRYATKTGNPIIDLFTKMEGDKRRYEEAVKNARLNPRYTFKSFIVGSNNRLAEAVAQSVVTDMENEGLSKSYNPVFYYGSTGVGKTHLMQAIGNEVLRVNPDRKVSYISIEQFLNEMIEAIRTKKNEEFRTKYREVDLLIIDDIQFVEAYPKTQEELFHTFNTLYQANKQIILASDRPPREIKNITDRLRTRFEGGMVCDIQPPEYETRLAILKQILAEKKVSVPDAFLDLIAKNIETSVRELEGSLNKVITLTKLGEVPSYEEVARILQFDIESKRKRVTPERVIEVVANEFGISTRFLKSSRKTNGIATARQIVMYILRTELELSLKSIAKTVGRKDHTTVLHACEMVPKKLKNSNDLAQKYEKCKGELFY